MKKKLLVITLVMAMLASLSACSPKIPTPTETADTFLTGMKAQDSEAIATVYAGGDIDLLDKAAEADDSSAENSAQACRAERKICKQPAASQRRNAEAL